MVDQVKKKNVDKLIQNKGQGYHYAPYMMHRFYTHLRYYLHCLTNLNDLVIFTFIT